MSTMNLSYHQQQPWNSNNSVCLKRCMPSIDLSSLLTASSTSGFSDSSSLSSSDMVDFYHTDNDNESMVSGLKRRRRTKSSSSSSIDSNNSVLSTISTSPATDALEAALSGPSNHRLAFEFEFDAYISGSSCSSDCMDEVTSGMARLATKSSLSS